MCVCVCVCVCVHYAVKTSFLHFPGFNAETLKFNGIQMDTWDIGTRDKSVNCLLACARAHACVRARRACDACVCVCVCECIYMFMRMCMLMCTCVRV